MFFWWHRAEGGDTLGEVTTVGRLPARVLGQHLPRNLNPGGRARQLSSSSLSRCLPLQHRTGRWSAIRITIKLFTALHRCGKAVVEKGAVVDDEMSGHRVLRRLD